MIHFPDPKLPVPQKIYTQQERNKFDHLIEQIQSEPNPMTSLALISKELTKEQENRFFQYCEDNNKIRQFRQTCLDCHQALSEHAAYLQENLQAHRQPEGPGTAQILTGLIERRDNLLGMYARHIVKDISASLEHNNASKKKPPRPKSYPQ
jgi:hypothetical protein